GVRRGVRAEGQRGDGVAFECSTHGGGGFGGEFGELRGVDHEFEFRAEAAGRQYVIAEGRRNLADLELEGVGVEGAHGVAAPDRVLVAADPQGSVAGEVPGDGPAHEAGLALVAELAEDGGGSRAVVRRDVPGGA